MNELNLEKKSFSEKAGDFLGKPVVRAILPILGLVVITLLLDALTHGKILQASSIKLMLSQVYVLMIAATGVFMIMTMGCLDASRVPEITVLFRLPGWNVIAPVLASGCVRTEFPSP